MKPTIIAVIVFLVVLTGFILSTLHKRKLKKSAEKAAEAAEAAHQKHLAYLKTWGVPLTPEKVLLGKFPSIRHLEYRLSQEGSDVLRACKKKIVAQQQDPAVTEIDPGKILDEVLDVPIFTGSSNFKTRFVW